MEQFTSANLKEATKLSSCLYEDNTKWGKMIGYSCDSLLESTSTGYYSTQKDASYPWFKVFATVYVSSLLQHLYEVLSTDNVTWWNEQRIYFIKCTSSLLFGCLDVTMKSFGVAKANFRLKNKVVDKEKLEK